MRVRKGCDTHKAEADSQIGDGLIWVEPARWPLNNGKKSAIDMTYSKLYNKS